MQVEQSRGQEAGDAGGWCGDQKGTEQGPGEREVVSELKLDDKGKGKATEVVDQETLQEGL